MIWAMGALLLQFHAVPQAVVPAAKAAVEAVAAPSVAPASAKLMLSGASAADETGPLEPGRLAPTPAVAVASPGASGAATPAPAASPAIAPVIAVTPRQLAYAARVGRGPRMAWIGLAVAGHSAATFDAWSTRRAITQGGAQELNPLLRPFAGNRSIYAAVQIGPTLLDLLGRKMMTSRHPFLRHTWWLPQVLGTAASLAGGAHNLGVR
jgi:hypothetical protein